jgi:4-amino-4-deoxy-L-arabinose transferase-like glycosyltransferase
MTVLRRTFWVVFIFAIALRLVAAFAFGGFANPERWEYDDIARAIVAGQGFTYQFHGITYFSYAPPLYSWLSVASYWLTGSLTPLMLVQVCVGAALAVASGAIAGRIFGSEKAALAAGLLVALHPGLIIYSATKAHPMTWDALFFSLAALQFLRLRERPGFRRALQLGLIVGIGTLSRTTIVIFLPIGALWLLWASGRVAWPLLVRQVLIAGVVATACLAPWTIRNYRVHDAFVFVVSTDGDVFWRGNNPNATGHSYAASGGLILDSLTPEERQDLHRQPTEVAQSAWFKARANAFIRDHPLEFVRLTATKFFYFWWFAPQTGVRYPASWFWASAAYYVAALLCAALGALRIVRLGRGATTNAVLLVVLLLVLSGLQSLYYVEGRHRWGVEPLLLAISGGGVAWLRDRYRDAT